MKKTTFSFFVILGFLLTGCVKEGPMGPEGLPGRDGNANVFYSPWYTPTQWAGKTGDWYFDVSDNAISEDIVEGGAILAYMSIPGDIYQGAVRPMPAYVNGANWDFLIPGYGMIEFTSDALNVPGTVDYSFRYVLIPSNIQLKALGTSLEELKKMPYQEVCKKLGISELK
jgi:hypothetical protein